MKIAIHVDGIESLYDTSLKGLFSCLWVLITCMYLKMSYPSNKKNITWVTFFSMAMFYPSLSLIKIQTGGQNHLTLKLANALIITNRINAVASHMEIIGPGLWLVYFADVFDAINMSTCMNILNFNSCWSVLRKFECTLDLKSCQL